MTSDPKSSSGIFSEDVSQYCECLQGTVPGVVYTLDKNGDFTFLSDSVESTLGVSRSELVGRHFSSIVHPGDLYSVSREHILPRFEGIPTGNERAPKLFDERRSWRRKTTDLQVRICPPKGAAGNEAQELNCKVNASGHYDRNNQFCGTVGIIYDVVDDNEAVFTAGRQQQYNAFELLTQALSHVFSNVFTGIYGNLQLIEMQLETTENVSDNISAIKHSVENAVTLVRKLAKMLSTHGYRNGYGLKNVLDDTAGEFFGSVGLEYTCDIAASLWHAETDPDYIRHIVRAVCFHIARCVAGKNVIAIGAANVHEASVKLPRVDCAYIKIDIDFISAIPLRNESKIEEFSSLERIASMALSYELLKKIGGTLSISTAGQNHSVRLFLPAVRSS